MVKESLGILGYESYTFVVENLARSREFYEKKLGFTEIARGNDQRTQRLGEQTSVFGAGSVRIMVSTPLTESSPAARYLRQHPAGISVVSFRVRDLAHTRALLESRAATFLDDVEESPAADGSVYRSFSIATPLGDVAFRYVERSHDPAFAPEFTALVAPTAHVENLYNFQHVDHVTANVRTMEPVLNWYRDTLGMEEFWRFRFHTNDVAEGRDQGTGLKSLVMWDSTSGVKFATNEPLGPFYERSQIAKFCRDNRGPGIQHLAFALPDLVPVVGSLHQHGLSFLTTPASYYRTLPERLQRLGITNVRESLEDLERLAIEIDGADNRYMLQIFLREAAATYDDERAGPFFYELIQRAGDEGFGYGNFRALFESIERDQKLASSTG